ncbi:hypothetical protein OG874_12990 [Nocardia sp. NBC_00565]|uniref:hypothetical protein n=1 Tax=Nocardia sp. NBC_00565 TaxID=2975993 RepID=UPI002E82383A|nr:hypothetical protein [Nocardia sp. NBC_00565]WUC05990.1 hypothetical protein OG874_12990 [Nocardia sp. NBC_00565]
MVRTSAISEPPIAVTPSRSYVLSTSLLRCPATESRSASAATRRPGRLRLLTETGRSLAAAIGNLAAVSRNHKDAIAATRQRWDADRGG